jgi:hypothetical protein
MGKNQGSGTKVSRNQILDELIVNKKKMRNFEGFLINRMSSIPAWQQKSNDYQNMVYRPFSRFITIPIKKRDEKILKEKP